MINIIKQLLLGVVLTASITSYASIINYDDTVANTFYDTDTGLVWLDTRMTGWEKYYSSQYSLSSSGDFFTVEENLLRFSDFRIANESEVRGLISNVFSNITFDIDGNYKYSDSWSRSVGGDRSQQDPLFHDDFNDFISVAGGSTYSSSNSYSDGDSRGSIQIDGLFMSGNSGYGYLSAFSSYDNDYSKTSFGNKYLKDEQDNSNIKFTDNISVDIETSKIQLWMVYSPNSVSVSEPQTLILFIFTLLGVGSHRVRSMRL